MKRIFTLLGALLLCNSALSAQQITADSSADKGEHFQTVNFGVGYTF
jgi:hypothetical protein